MNRLYVVESAPDQHRAGADHRLPLRAPAIERFALAVAASVGVAGLPAGADDLRGLSAQHSDEHLRRWLAGVAADLRRTGARAWSSPATSQPAGGARAGARDQPGARQRRPDRHLHRAGRGGRIRSARVARRPRRRHGRGPGRPARDPRRQPRLHRAGGPRVREAARRRSRFAWRSACTTTRRRRSATGTCPRRTYLESWSDARAFDGTASIVQPLIAPLYGGKGAHEVVAAFTKQAGQSALRDRARLLEGAPGGRAAGGRLRALLAQGAPRRHRGRNGVAAEGGGGDRLDLPGDRRRHARRAGSRSSSVPTPPSTTAASPTTAGCRSCRSRTPSSPGTTPCC